jgi:hypothetical protein
MSGGDGDGNGDGDGDGDGHSTGSHDALVLSFLVVQGSLDDHAGLVAAIKEVDVVISTVGGPAIPEQEKIIAAIKEAGNVLVKMPPHTIPHQNLLQNAGI